MEKAHRHEDQKVQHSPARQLQIKSIRKTTYSPRQQWIIQERFQHGQQNIRILPQYLHSNNRRLDEITPRLGDLVVCPIGQFETIGHHFRQPEWDFFR